MAGLFDSTDRSVEAHIVYAGLGVVAVIICAIIFVILDVKDFHLSDLGIAIGSIMTGSGVGAVGQGIQSRITPP
jgi:hypothetical protein